MLRDYHPSAFLITSGRGCCGRRGVTAPGPGRGARVEARPDRPAAGRAGRRGFVLVPRPWAPAVPCGNPGEITAVAVLHACRGWQAPGQCKRNLCALAAKQQDAVSYQHCTAENASQFFALALKTLRASECMMLQSDGRMLGPRSDQPTAAKGQDAVICPHIVSSRLFSITAVHEPVR